MEKGIRYEINPSKRVLHCQPEQCEKRRSSSKNPEAVSSHRGRAVARASGWLVGLAGPTRR